LGHKMEARARKLEIGGVAAEDLAARYGSPLYVYDEDVIRARARALRDAFPARRFDIRYAAKANTNLAVMRALREEGMLADATSPGEVLAGLKAGWGPDQILFTGTSVTDEEMRWVVGKGVMVNADSLGQLERYGRIAPGTRVSVRINPDVGAGHHDHVITGGPHSKFGIYFDRLEEARTIAARHKLRIVGLHQHIGSGVLDADVFCEAIDVLLKAALDMPGLEFVDFGGGIGVPYRPDEKPIDIAALGRKAVERLDAFARAYGSPVRGMIEPGRYLVAESGTLLVTVNTIKTTPAHTFACVDSGFNHLVRHAMYGSYHPIANASRTEGPRKEYVVAGNLCESGDVFSSDREIVDISVGDVLAIGNAGAYGFAMSSNYNMRPRPAEVMVRGGEARLVGERETYAQLLRETPGEDGQGRG